VTRLERSANIGAVLLPFVAFCVAVTLLWGDGVGLALRVGLRARQDADAPTSR